MNNKFRTGIGFDVHSFAENRKLILGGVEIPFEKGLAGHSDADVLLHAISDAILGALALGDIGMHFPDTDMKYKDADSSVLLTEIYKLVRQKKYSIGNLDAVIMLQRPKISPYSAAMKKKISSLLGTNADNISIKATTTERLGFTGREEGVAAMVTVLLSKDDE
ncbi:MAG: 2-C-methyl-D-erythritol 2,4-cyclodiphosphate synthase [Ignavibacteriales bacterium]|nr:MAG: 2-C-methyl-D-erythritol 2,4-cyclodiphosphate synthase [Ignavibacteriales bacterium]